MRSVSRHFTSLGAGMILLAVLVGCGSLGALTGGTDEFDGAWVGRLQFASGENACLRRGGIRADISFGDVGGDVSWYNFSERSRISGVIKKGGIFSGTASKGSNIFADLEGVFADRNAEGTWKSKRCRGSWTMRKVRNAS